MEKAEDEQHPRALKCDICNYAAPELDNILHHFKNIHNEETMKIRIPLIGPKRKYSVMNYGISFSKLGDGHFYIDSNTY